MKRALILFAGMWVLSVGFAGCSDETECQICPLSESTPELFAIGTASFEAPEQLTVVIDVYNTAGTGDRVESAFADDLQLCVRDAPYAAAEDGHQLVRTVGGEYCPSGLIPPFFATDTTTFTLYCDGHAHQAQLHLLDPAGAMPRNLTADADSASATLSIDWDPVAKAEWYSVKVRSKYNFAGPWQWDFQCVDSTAVTLSLPLKYTQISDVRIYVAAGTGPRPNKAGPQHNISGPHITGCIYSVSNDAYFYLELTPLVGTADARRGEWIDPPSLRDMMKSHLLSADPVE